MDNWFIIDPQVHTNDADPQTGKIVPGYEVTARDGVTGTRVVVFVPDAYYSAENVRTAVEQKIEAVRAVAALSQPPAAG